MAASKTRKRYPKRPRETYEADLADALEYALTNPGTTGNEFNRFYTYSFLNQMFMRMQGARGPVATYNRWQELGRNVTKDSKALWVNVPIFIKVPKDKNDENSEKISKLVGFKFNKGPFDFAQTEGEELPPFEVPGWNLDTALTALDVTEVPFEYMDGNTGGYSFDRKFAINPMTVHRLRTLFHELGHIVLGHTTEDKQSDYTAHRGLMEFQADAVAYLVTRELAVNTDESDTAIRGYLQGWLKGEDKPNDAAIRQVFTAVTKILDAGREDATTKSETVDQREKVPA